MVLPSPIFQLQCPVNSYEWGKVGRDSKAAKFGIATKQSGFSIEESTPYAELWMGTHPSGPSIVVEAKRELAEILDENQALIGQEIYNQYHGKLPFLFKVLSINKALSIQAHPDIPLAKKLHASDPKNYKDDNHKPEMAIAITPFEGFCGFRPIEEISSFVHSIPEFSSLLGASIVQEFQDTISGGKATSKQEENIKSNRSALQKIFAVLMRKQEPEIIKAAEALVKSAKSQPSQFGGSFGGAAIANLVIRLNEQFPNDIGLFCIFFLNYVTMQPGEAMFLQACDIHAYISGDIIECMAASDNVVRAGFTPKFKDVDNLVKMLTYAYAPPSEQKMSPEKWDRGSSKASTLYDPPIEEFSVVQTELKKGDKETHQAVRGPSIIISTTGDGELTAGNKIVEIKEGQVFFVGADAELELQAGAGPFVTYRAFVEAKK